jgi:hypothetical protein
MLLSYRDVMTWVGNSLPGYADEMHNLLGLHRKGISQGLLTTAHRNHVSVRFRLTSSLICFGVPPRRPQRQRAALRARVEMTGAATLDQAFAKAPTCATLEPAGPVAQRLEQQTHNLLVVGSNPTGPTKTTHREINPTMMLDCQDFGVFQLAISVRSLSCYTGLPLDWSLISTYNNKQARAGGSQYLRKFAHMPTVDHEFEIDGKHFRFVICSWRVNDAKTHLTEQEFCELCTLVRAHRPQREPKGRTPNVGGKAFREQWKTLIHYILHGG